MDSEKKYRHDAYSRRRDDSSSSDEYRGEHDYNTKRRGAPSYSTRHQTSHQFNDEEPTTTYSHHSQRRPHGGKKEGSLFDAVLGNQEEKEVARAFIAKGAQEAYGFGKENIPGFFTPFRSKKEFGIVAAAPLGLPIASALITGAALIGAAGATLTALGSLVYAAGLGLDGLRKGHENSKGKSHDALMLAAKAGIVAAVCAAVTIAAAVFTAVIFPIALTYLLTRSAATGIAKISECTPSCGSKEENNYESAYTM